ncbi:MAG: OmpA family protein [Armatimonadota bacterium]|nr:OmpA family protein [Armatimonadota bacterium]
MAGHTRNRRKGGHGGGGEHENAERWLLTYADMITLLVAFFIMLYAMSVMNVQKFQQLAISVRSGFGSSMMNGEPSVLGNSGVSGMPSILANGRQPNEDGKSQKDGGLDALKKDQAARQDAHNLDKAYEVIQAYIKKNHLENVMHAERDERGVVVTVMTDKMLFASGAADLRPEETGLLSKVAAVADTVPNQVRVEGHTDNLPIHTARFPSNWELSTMRATVVLRFFEKQGIASNRLEAAGYAEQHPIVPNDTEAHRATNRRVEVVILKRF